MTTQRVIVKRQKNATTSRLILVAAAVPSIAAIAAIVTVGISLRHSSDVAPDWYRTTADDAFDAGDFKTAAVCYQRLLQTQPDDPVLTMDLAQSLSHVGQAEATASLLFRLAPLDRPGYFPAQIALASSILQSTNPQPDALATAEKHLKQALNARPTDPQANGWMAILLSQRGDWAGVNSFMGKYPDPPAALCRRLSLIAAQLGNAAEKDHWDVAASTAEAAQQSHLHL